jgi:hypothetical protein
MEYLQKILALIATLSERKVSGIAYDARTGAWSAVLDTLGLVEADDLTSLAKRLEDALHAERAARVAALETEREALAARIAELQSL